MLAAGRDIVRGDGPLEAEVIASSLLGIWWGRELIDVDIEEVLGAALVDEAARRRTAESLALLRSTAAVARGRLAIRAATAAAELEHVGVSGPRWLDQVGRAELMDCWRTWDTTGDGVSVILEYAYPGQPRHVVAVLIDRSLGGLAKDAWATEHGDEVMAGYREGCAKSDQMFLEQIAPATARALVETAFGVTSRALRHDPPLSDEARSHHALTLARIQQLPEVEGRADLHPEDERFRGQGWPAERDRFLATAGVRELKRPRIVRGCVEAILDYSERCDAGRLLRVSPVKVELLLLDWLPIWAGLTKSQVDVLPEVLELWCRHAVALTDQPAEVLAECLGSLRRFSAAFAESAHQSVPEAFQMIREHVSFEDVWERAEQVERLSFALLAEPDGWLDFEPDTLEDDLYELARLAHSGDDADLQLHLAIHTMVSSQLWVDDPPEVWETTRRLLLSDYDQHEVHHMLASAVLEPMRAAKTGKGAFDLADYIERLAALPGSWEVRRPSE